MKRANSLLSRMYSKTNVDRLYITPCKWNTRSTREKNFSRERLILEDLFQLNRKKKREEKWKNKRRRGKEKDGETASSYWFLHTG